MYSDADAAPLYDPLNPWDTEIWPSEGFTTSRSRARAWTDWNEVQAVAGDMVTITGTTAGKDGTVLCACAFWTS